MRISWSISNPLSLYPSILEPFNPSTLTLTLGFSPCPNDTFIFDALVNGKIDTGGLQFEVVLEDVETLNRWAAEGRLDITKLSFSALLRLADHYALLRAGAALGKGVGPLLVSARPAADMAPKGLAAWLRQAHIAIPGMQTTANLLLSLAFPEARNKTEVLFSEIESQVLEGVFDAGLLIHEGRFTYQQKGLFKLLDLGAWWEEESGQAIPLGGIAVRRSTDPALCARVDDLIRKSLAYAWRHYPLLPPFVTEHAQEMEAAVMRQHIELYVNEQSHAMDAAAHRAILCLQERAVAAGLALPPRAAESLWY